MRATRAGDSGRAPGVRALRCACGRSSPPRAPAPGRFVFPSPPSGPRGPNHPEGGRGSMARPDKAAAVAELTDQFRNSSAAVLTEYRGLTVAQLKNLRRSLGENAQYAVVKNTLTKIAANEGGIA